jgi:hypothetical protein
VEAFIAALQGQVVVLAGPTLKHVANIMSEIKKIANEANISVVNEKYGSRLGKGYIMQFSGLRPDDARGKNANLLILDEAAYCREYFYSEVLFNTVRLKEPEPRILIASTPKGTDNWLSKRFLEPDGNTATFKATYLDNKHTNERWKVASIEEYAIRGEMAMRRELMGEILDYTENSPFSQFLKNINYAETWEQDNSPVCVGVDLGGGGDFSSVAVRKGNRLLAIAKAKTPEDEDLQRLVEQTINAAGYMQADKLYFDGTSLVKFTKGLFTKFAGRVIPVNFGAKATDKRCVNLRAQCYIGLLDKMREGITYGAQCATLKNELVRDLLSARPTPDEANQGKFGLIKKELIKKEINRSPDIADSVALAFVEYNPPDLAKAQEMMAGYMD